MKKITVLSAFFVLFAFLVNAQNVHFGLSAGANLTSMNGNGLDSKWHSGIIAGGYTRISLNKKWEIQGEVLYNLTNTKKSDEFINYYNTTGNSGADASIKLSYLSVPVLLGYKVSKLLTINAGPQYGLLLYNNENLLMPGLGSAFKRNDFGITAGAQLRIENISFFGRYNYGLLNINKIDNRYKWYNRQLQFGLNVNVF